MTLVVYGSLTISNYFTVDLQITDESHSTKDSWTGNEIIVNCMVRVADGVRVHFTWKRETDSENKTLSREKHLDTETQSELTLNTDEDEDFGDLLCFARTPSTEKVHRIKIRRLCKYNLMYLFFTSYICSIHPPTHPSIHESTCLFILVYF